MEIISRVEPVRGPAQLRSIQRVLTDLRRRDLADYLQKVLDDDSTTKAIAGRSSVHANGFSKLVLDRRAGLALRLHVWEGETPDVELENVHDHVWSFASRVLIGTLHEQRFRRAWSGALMDHYRYVRPRATLPPGNLELLGQMRLGMQEELSHPGGTTYHVDDAALHRAWNVTDGGLAATLVLTGTPRRDGASVFAHAGVHVREDAEDARLSVETVRRLVGTVVEFLR